jgi:hypothetical protein
MRAVVFLSLIRFFTLPSFVFALPILFVRGIHTPRMAHSAGRATTPPVFKTGEIKVSHVEEVN